MKKRLGKKREFLFSVTVKDCRFDYYRGSGAGGQHRNKTDSAVRCHHDPSGAVAQAQDTRSQHKNKVLAFGRMARSKKFQNWIRREAASRAGQMESVEDAVKAAMNSRNLRIDVKDNRGRWIPA